jgi:hypothetical protein
MKLITGVRFVSVFLLLMSSSCEARVLPHAAICIKHDDFGIALDHISEIATNYGFDLRVDSSQINLLKDKKPKFFVWRRDDDDFFLSFYDYTESGYVKLNLNDPAEEFSEAGKRLYAELAEELTVRFGDAAVELIRKPSADQTTSDDPPC